MVNNIFFYCPSKKIGGEQQLYIRCSNYLVTHTDANVFYVDYIDGYAQGVLSEKVIRIDKNQMANYYFEASTLFIIALSYIDKYYELFNVKQLPESFRVLFWSLQPYNLTGKILIRNRFNLLLPWQKKKFRDVLYPLCNDGIIRIMDYNNYHTLHQVFGLDLTEIDYLPVPIDDDGIRSIEEISFSRVCTDKLTFLWLSRIDHDKKHTLMTIINELDNVNKCHPVLLYVVGDGNALEEVKSYSANKSLEIVFVGRCFGDKLNSLIDEKVDVGVGMGTSGLEIAKRGKPVIMKMVMKKTQKAGIVNDYIFLHQEYGYSLGSPDFDVEGQSVFSTKVEDLLNDYASCARCDYEYTKRNHSIETTGQLLVRAMEKPGMTEEDNMRVYELSKLIREYRLATFRKG